MGKREGFEQLRRSVGERIRRRRKRLGLSQEVVAERLGVSYQQVQKYENGKSSLSVERLVQLAGVLGATPGYFIQEIESRAGRADAIAERPAGYVLSNSEKRFVDLIRSVPDASRKTAVYTILRGLAKG